MCLTLAKNHFCPVSHHRSQNWEDYHKGKSSTATPPPNNPRTLILPGAPCTLHVNQHAGKMISILVQCQHHQTTSPWNQAPHLSENPSMKRNHHGRPSKSNQVPTSSSTAQTKDPPKPKEKGSQSIQHPSLLHNRTNQRLGRPEVTKGWGILPVSGWATTGDHLSRAHRLGGLGNICIESPHLEPQFGDSIRRSAT